MCARSLGFDDVSLVVWAVKRGRRELRHIFLKWTPGQYEGSQGTGLGPCNAEINIWIIDSIRLDRFGRGPVPPTELLVYTDIDE